MAVAYDAASESHTGTTASSSEASFSWTHTPVGTPAGVLVYVMSLGNPTDQSTGVTYGGVSLATDAAWEANDTLNEGGTCRAYYLGASVPTGAQTVVVSRANTIDHVYAVAITVTAASDTEVYTAGVVLLEEDGTLAEQSVTDGSPGTDSLRFAGGAFGHADVPAAGASSTAVHSIDIGVRVAAAVRETTAGQGSRSVGFSDALSDDRAVVHLAVRETYSYTLTAAAGTFTLTGNATGVTAQRSLTAAQATFTLTGTATGLLAARSLPAALGTFTISGPDTGLTAQRLLTADAGACTLSGTATGLTLARLLTASAGAFVLTGVDATLTYSGTTGYTLTAAAGSFALTGQAATLAAARLLTAGAGTLTLTGVDAALTAARLLTAGTGAVTLTGADAGVYYGRYLAGGAGVFTLTGNAATLTAARLLSATVADYTLTGVAVTLSYSNVYMGMVRLTARNGAALRLTGARGPASTFYSANGPAVRLTPREPGA